MKSCSSDVIQVPKEGEEASSLLVVPDLESNNEEWKTIQMLLCTCIGLVLLRARSHCDGNDIFWCRQMLM